MTTSNTQSEQRIRPRVNRIVAAAILLGAVGGIAAYSQKSPTKSGVKQPAGKTGGKTIAAKTTADKKVAAGKSKSKRRKKPPPIPFAETPYRVRVSVAFSGSNAMLPPFRRNVLAEIRSGLRRGYGAMWDAEVVENDWLTPAGQLGLQRLTSGPLLDRFPKSRAAGLPGYDKIYFLSVESNSGPGMQISGREWDVRSQQFSTLRSQLTLERRLVGDLCYEQIVALFRPILLVHGVEGYTVRYELRAALIPPRDSTLVQLRKDDVVIPYFRYMDKSYVTQRVETLPWTYTIVESVSRQHVTAKIISAFRAPLGSGKRRRTEMLGTRVRPQGKASRLQMVYQTDETNPLAGYNVTLVRKLFHRERTTQPKLNQFSGRDGYVDVPVDPDHPVVWVYVYSGKALLARVPYVPGLAGNETIPLPDDSLRLSVEGDIALLMGDLIDTIARRATMMALVLKHYHNSKLSDAESRKRITKLFQQMRELTTKDRYLQTVSDIRGPRLAAANRLKNRFAISRINKMCDKAEVLIKEYLKPGIIDQFADDLKNGKFEKEK